MNNSLRRLVCDYSLIEKKKIQHVKESPEDSEGNSIWSRSNAEKVYLKVKKTPKLGSINVIGHSYLLVDHQIQLEFSSGNLLACSSLKWVPVELQGYGGVEDFWMPLAATEHKIVDRTKSEYRCFGATDKINAVESLVLNNRCIPRVDLFYTELSRWYCSERFANFARENDKNGCFFTLELTSKLGGG